MGFVLQKGKQSQLLVLGQSLEFDKNLAHKKNMIQILHTQYKHFWSYPQPHPTKRAYLILEHSLSVFQESFGSLSSMF